MFACTLRGIKFYLILTIENLARYIIRASFSRERMNYISEQSKVIYKSKNGNNTKE
jgi:hypothetical protein